MRINPALDRVGAHPIAAIQQRVRAMRAANQPLIDFSLGDPREETWSAIPTAVREAVPPVSQYPTTTGLPDLRSAIADYVQRRMGVAVDPETQVIPTSGSKEAIFSTHLAFVDRGRDDVVGYPDPAYPVYQRGALMAGATATALPTDDRFVLTADSICEEVWKRAVMLWICTPSNPTGAVTSDSELGELVEVARTNGTLLCSDECYIDLYEPGTEPPTSVLTAAGTGSNHVLSFLSLSKRSGMTGYRSGAIVGDPEAIARIVRLRTSTGTASPEFIQTGAMLAWGDDVHPEERRQVFSAKRRILTEFFERREHTIGGDPAGLYVWVAVGSDDVAITERLLEAGVVVSPGSIFGSRGAGWIRLALVPTVAECEEAVATLESLF